MDTGGNLVPWLLAFLNGLWFGWRARQAGRTWPLWFLGGGLMALVIATVAYGLRHATCIPFSNRDLAVCHLEWIIAAVLINAGLGWAIDAGLRNHRPVAGPVLPGAATSVAPASGPDQARSKGPP